MVNSISLMRISFTFAFNASRHLFISLPIDRKPPHPHIQLRLRLLQSQNRKLELQFELNRRTLVSNLKFAGAVVLSGKKTEVSRIAGH